MSSDLLPIAQLVNWDSFRRRPIVSNESKSFIHYALLCNNACNFDYWLLNFNTHLPYCLKPCIISTPLINKIHNHVFVIISKPGQNIFITCTLNYLTNGNCIRLYFTVKPDKSFTCVIHFPVLCNVDFHAVLSIFYVFTLSNLTPCLLRHTNFLDRHVGLERFHCISESIIFFSIPCRHLEHHRVFQGERTKHVRARLRA